MISPRSFLIPKRRPKYGAVRTVADGISYASKKEARRGVALGFLLRAGEVTDLVRQKRYAFDVNGQHICTYVADFVYRDKGGTLIVEDVKGYKTDEYRIKRKLMKAIYGIDILET